MLYENAHVAPILYHKDGAHASNVGRQPVEDNLRKNVLEYVHSSGVYHGKYY